MIIKKGNKIKSKGQKIKIKGINLKKQNEIIIKKGIK